MDDATRGFIENSVDNLLNREILQRIEWIQRETPISSLRDVALGYIVLSIEALAEGAVMMNHPEYRISEKDKEDIRSIIKRRLPDIFEKIERELNV